MEQQPQPQSRSLSKKEVTLITVGSLKPHLVEAVVDGIMNDLTGYELELKYDLPVNTAYRHIKKVKQKINEFNAINAINENTGG